MIRHSSTIQLPCPYCHALCQFVELQGSKRASEIDSSRHFAYCCTNCNGLVATIWEIKTIENGNYLCLNTYHPGTDAWKPRIDLSLITNDKVKDDFYQAIKCYSNGLYNACMIMARRTIQQEMIARNIKGDNLYNQIENTGISQNLKKLLHKVKNFGNNGAHPDFCLYDNDGKEIENKEEIAKLSFRFFRKIFYGSI